MNRRGFLTGLGAVLITAPAIVRAGSLMPVRVVEFEFSTTHLVTVPYLENLFVLLASHPSMTATHVIEILNERGMLVRC